MTACCLLRLFRRLLVETDGLVGDWSRFCITPQPEWCRPVGDWRICGHRLVTGRGWWLRVGGSAPGIRRNSLEFRFQLVGGRSKPADSALTQTVLDVFMTASGLRADSPFPLPDCAGLGRKRHKRRLNNSSLLGCLFWFSLQKRCAVVVPTKSLPQICQAGGCEPRPSKTTEPTLGRNKNPDLLTSKDRPVRTPRETWRVDPRQSLQTGFLVHAGPDPA